MCYPLNVSAVRIIDRTFSRRGATFIGHPRFVFWYQFIVTNRQHPSSDKDLKGPIDM